MPASAPTATRTRPAHAQSDPDAAPDTLATTTANGVEWLDALTGWRLSDNGDGAYDLEQTRDSGQSWSKIKTVLWQGQLDFVSE